MAEFTVTWQINIAADTHEEAALLAYGIQQDPASIATVYLVDDANDVRVVIDTEGNVATVVRDERNSNG